MAGSPREDVPAENAGSEVAPAAPAPATPPSEPAEDWATRFKYLLADFENFRKRAAREREALRQLVRSDVLLSILPLYESAQRAREAVAGLSASDPIRRGVDLLVHEWQAVLDAHHVQPTAAVGQPFQSEWHEAVAEAPVGSGARPGNIAEVVQQGYRMDGALLRPAKVVVVRAPAAETVSSAEPATDEHEST